jgi:tryptophanyl-tRNA synthetase
MAKTRVMSGMRPTAKLQIGNYFGALKNWLALQKDNECFFGVVDWHAMTDAYKKPAEVNELVRDFVAEWVAWGIDPEKHTIFVQSRVPEHIELNTMFANITPMGWLERVTTWKDQEEELKQKDAYNLGRFAYPVLQAADIALYKGQKVPVGQDQIPHLELSREIIRRFNHLYGLKIPEPEQLLTSTPYIVGIDGRKMSKSYGNVVPLTAEPAEIEALTKKMVTDPARVRRNDPGSPEKSTVGQFHKLFSSFDDLKWVEHGCTTAGIGCGECKALLATNINKFMKEPLERKKELLNDPKRLDSIIIDGSEKARRVAQETMREIRDAMGFHGGMRS